MRRAKVVVGQTDQRVDSETLTHKGGGAIRQYGMMVEYVSGVS